MNQQVSPHFEFGPFHLDPGESVLLHRGQALPLTQKQIETLLVLVQNSGRLVKKEDLMNQVWSDACVEPANLTQTIFVLRRCSLSTSRRSSSLRQRHVMVTVSSPL